MHELLVSCYVEHMAGRSTKATKVKDIVRGEFKKNMSITDPAKIDELRGHAIQVRDNSSMLRWSAFFSCRPYHMLYSSSFFCIGFG